MSTDIPGAPGPTPKRTFPPTPEFSYGADASVAAFAVSEKTYLQNKPQFDRLVVGALVYDPQGRLLLIRRAAHDFMPLTWEIPGGALDASDATILDGLARELWEETGLLMRRVVRQVRCGPRQEGAEFVVARGVRMCKYSFEVEVEACAPVVLDPEEHCGYLWAKENECLAQKMDDGREIEITTVQQVWTIHEGFRIRRDEEGVAMGEGVNGEKS